MRVTRPSTLERWANKMEISENIVQTLENKQERLVNKMGMSENIVETLENKQERWVNSSDKGMNMEDKWVNIEKELAYPSEMMANMQVSLVYRRTKALAALAGPFAVVVAVEEAAVVPLTVVAVVATADETYEV